MDFHSYHDLSGYALQCQLQWARKSRPGLSRVMAGLPIWRLARVFGWWWPRWTWTTDRFLIRESSCPSDVLRLVAELPWPSFTVHRCPLAVAAIVTQL